MTGYVRDLRAWMGPWRRFRRSLAKRRSLPPALARIDAVDGQISRAEAELLYELAAGVTTGVIVEVGTFHGKSTVALALGAQAGARPRVFGVDPFVTFTGEYGRTFTPAEKIPLLQNLLLAGVAEHVWLLQTTSQQAAAGWTEPIGFLWIDGDHSYDGARGDFTAAAPRGWCARSSPPATAGKRSASSSARPCCARWRAPPAHSGRPPGREGRGARFRRPSSSSGSTARRSTSWIPWSPAGTCRCSAGSWPTARAASSGPSYRRSRRRHGRRS